MPHLTGKTGPIDKKEYDSIPFKNIAIDTMKRNKLNSYNKLVKDVELYDPKTKKLIPAPKVKLKNIGCGT